MKKLLVKLLLAFLASIFLFISILVAIFFIGYNKSLKDWSNEKSKAIEAQLLEDLKTILPKYKPEEREFIKQKISNSIPKSIFLVVYNSEKQIIYQQKGQKGGGKGRIRSQQMETSELTLKPVKLENTTYGYYSIGQVGFGLERANLIFLGSMRKAILFGLLFAFIFSLFLAFILSKKISKSAKIVATGIDRIARGELTHNIPEKGVNEIALIARSANKLAYELKREGELRQQLASDIAHDLRTPISALKLQIEGIADGVLDLSRERILKNLKEIERVESLVDDLGELTRLESPEMKLSPLHINTEKFFKELDNRFFYLFYKKEISVNWEKDIDTFIADEHLIFRAISNFISNAIRHTQVKGKITISVIDEGEKILFRVHNTGKGIKKEEIDRVFDRLYRGDMARHTPGSGLGLTIAQKIAELHGGSVTIKSSEESGTTVEMRIKPVDLIK